MKTYKHFYFSFLTIPVCFLLNVPVSYSQTAQEWYDLGIDTGDNKQKIRYFENAIRENENFAMAYYQKGVVLSKTFKYEEAIGLFSTAISIEERAEFYDARAETLFLLKDYPKALTDFNASLTRNPNNKKTLLLKATTLIELTKFEDALNITNNILKVEPLNTNALTSKAICLINLSKVDEGLIIIKEMLKREPRNQDALFSMAKYYERINDKANAKSTYTQILAINNKHIKASEAISRIDKSEKECNNCGDISGLPKLSQFKRKYGLMIGNSAYASLSGLMSKPINDANDIAKLLKTLGVDTRTSTNLDLNGFNNKLNSFCNEVENADAVFLFYAGHGFEKDGLNYLIPTDAKFPIDYQNYIKIQDILYRLQQKNVKYIVMIIDACRSYDRGFVPIPASDTTVKHVKVTPNAASNYYIAYATLSGETAGNGSTKNGIYTAALLKNLVRGIRIDDAFRNTRTEVLNMSGNLQLPENLEGMSKSFIID
jgi:tetratricopeptide (TPR) repeat protein